MLFSWPIKLTQIENPGLILTQETKRARESLLNCFDGRPSRVLLCWDCPTVLGFVRTKCILSTRREPWCRESADIRLSWVLFKRQEVSKWRPRTKEEINNKHSDYKCLWQRSRMTEISSDKNHWGKHGCPTRVIFSQKPPSWVNTHPLISLPYSFFDRGRKWLVARDMKMTWEGKKYWIDAQILCGGLYNWPHSLPLEMQYYKLFHQNVGSISPHLQGWLALAKSGKMLKAFAHLGRALSCWSWKSYDHHLVNEPGPACWRRRNLYHGAPAGNQATTRYVCEITISWLLTHEWVQANRRTVSLNLIQTADPQTCNR